MAKYRVLRPMTYAGETFSRGDVVSDAFLIENTAGDGFEKRNVLLRTRYIEDVRDPERMVKDELVRYARQLDLKVNPSDNKSVILQQVADALATGDDVQRAAAKAKKAS